MGLFATNWRTQVINLLPPFLRSNSLQDYLAALVHPLQTDIDGNSAFNDDIRIKARFNSQKMVLQAALNYLLSTSGIIVLPSQSTVQKVFIYNEADPSGFPLWTTFEIESPYPLFLWNEAETPDLYDITIQVPVGFYNATVGAQITAYMKLYKLGGKSFTITTY